MTSVHFKDDDFQFGLEVALGATYRQAADVGEVLATAGRIGDGDSDSWVHEWTATAGASWSQAAQAEQRGRLVSAVGHLRRAATYYATALYRISHCSEPERELALWRRQRACWDRLVDLLAVPGERVSIAYETTTLPGYFFRAPGAEAGERRPLVIINNGSDGATSQMWVHGGAAASERGYHWMTFDGPGQQAALFEQEIPFRPDWEAVLTPVLDAMLERPDVDPDRVAVIGISQAGYWVPRALAFEHRFAAAAVDPGVVDVSSSWLDPLPEVMRKQLREGRQAAFDREMHLVGLLSPNTAATLRFRGKPYGLAGSSIFALYQSVSAYQLNEEIGQITTPVLITDPEGEQFWPGQSQQLYDRLEGPKHLVRFRSQEGAGRHCEPLACAQRDTRIFDWLDLYLVGDHRGVEANGGDSNRHPEAMTVSSLTFADRRSAVRSGKGS
ncbi:MAG: alpha/beta hydrolase [Solirubrobacterales bacterium]|nr:alpha/beta hydrolase [Solirubrobacterales bacterium]MBV9942856.1 alpha/beta hydrolase [Solirubrobacterales bacterium]